MSTQEYERYCATVRDTAAWGGEPEILALCKAFNVSIHVIQGASPNVVVHDPAGAPQSDKKAEQVVRISYHRRMYGLGEVRPHSRCGSIHRLNLGSYSTITHYDQNEVSRTASRRFSGATLLLGTHDQYLHNFLHHQTFFLHHRHRISPHPHANSPLDDGTVYLYSLRLCSTIPKPPCPSSREPLRLRAYIWISESKLITKALY